MSSKRGGTKSEQHNAQKDSETRKKVAEITLDAVLNDGAKQQAEAVRQISTLTEQKAAQIQELESIKRANQIEKEEAERIHGVAAIALSVEEAEAAAELRKAEIQREEIAFNLIIQDQKNALERSLRDEANRQNAEQARKKEAWEFQFEIDKRNIKATLDENLRQSALNEQVRKEALERSWGEREAAIKKQEAEIETLRQTVAGIPAQVDAAVKKEVAIVSSGINRDYKHIVETLQVKQASEIAVLNGKLENATLGITAKDKIITDLTAQITMANKQVSDIATKALEAAQGRQQLADTQALNQSLNNGQKRA